MNEKTQLRFFGAEKKYSSISSMTLRTFSYLSLLIIFAASCSPKPLTGTFTSSDSISGSVLPLATQSSRQQSFQEGSSRISSTEALSSQQAQSKLFASSCSDTRADLYKINTQGIKIEPAVASTLVDPTGNYKFKYRANLEQDAFLVEVKGCSETLSRFITSKVKQDVSQGTSLVTWMTQSSQYQNVTVDNLKKLDTLLQGLQSNDSVSLAYSTLNTNPELSGVFQNLFGTAPTTLLDVAPREGELQVPSEALEEAPVNISITASHWLPTYREAFLWKLDGVTISNAANSSFIPSANSQGRHTLTAYYGQDDGNGALDINKPFKSKLFSILVNDSVPAVAPSLSLVSSSYTNNSNIIVRINTGALLSNCKSFSKLALSEDTPIPPLLESDYNLACTQNSTQDFNFNLTGGQGLRTIRLWARDAAGKVSQASSNLSLTYDTALPIVIVNAPSTGSAKGTFTLSGTCEAGLTLGVTGNLVTSQTTSCIAGIFSLSVNLSAGEGAKTLSLSQTDLAGNVGTTNLNLLRDDTAPVLAFSSPLGNTSTQNSLTITGTCGTAPNDNSLVTITGAITGSSVSTSCSSGSYSQVVSLTGTDGTKTLTLTQIDQALNQASVTRDFIKDTTAPILTLTSPLVGSFNSASITAQGACETGLNVVVTGTYSDSFVCSSAAFNKIYTLAGVDGAQSIDVTQTDAAGNSTVRSVSFFHDATAPTVSNLSINAGASSTNINFIQTSFQMNDSYSKVTKFCLKYNSNVAPNVANPCWIAVNSPTPGLTPAQSITVPVSPGYNYQIGLSPGSYSLYLWAMDEAQNISQLSNSGSGTQGSDLYAITYLPSPPPELTNVMTFSSTTPSSPPTDLEQTSAAGTNLFIKWRATSSSFGATPISIQYTTDDVNYINIPGATALINGVNGSCTPDDASSTYDNGSTGCFIWTSPVSSYYKVRVTAKDSNQMTTFANSNPLNVAGIINLVAGNTEPGLNGSATSAMFFSYLASSAMTDSQTFAVKSDGTIFFRDIYRGILKVSPSDGVQSVFIPTSGVASGDGGLASSATLRQPNRVVLDFDENLLVWDYDKIRKINLTTGIITTLIGGGSSVADNVDPTDVVLTPLSYQTYSNSIIPAPNGDIYFLSGNFLQTAATGYRIRVLRKSTNKVNSIQPGGLGLANRPTQDVTECISYSFGMSFDLVNKNPTNLLVTMITSTATPNCLASGQAILNPSTGQTNGKFSPAMTYYYSGSSMDGESYFASRIGAKVQKFNSQTGTYTTLAGTGSIGSCEDGTAALSCNIDVQDVFTTAQGKVYLLDKGRIRLIDDQGKIQTVMGQSYSYGDGARAQSARFNKLSNLGQWEASGQNKIVMLDQQEYSFREVTLGANIQKIAGNSQNAVFAYGVAATTQPLSIANSGSSFDDFEVNPTNGNLFFQNGTTTAFLNRSSGFWQNIIGGGGTSYTTGDGLNGNQIFAPPYPARPLGFNGSKLLLMMGSYAGSVYTNTFMKLYDITSSYKQSQLLGVVGDASTSSGWCADGTAGNACAIPNSKGFNVFGHATYDAYFSGGRWVTNGVGSKYARTISEGGNIGTLNSTPFTHPAISMTYIHDATMNLIYYCSMTDKKLHKYDVSTNIDTALNWPIASISCSQLSRTLIHIPSRNSLVFAYTQNNLDGIAEYILP